MPPEEPQSAQSTSSVEPLAPPLVQHRTPPGFSSRQLYPPLEPPEPALSAVEPAQLPTPPDLSHLVPRDPARIGPLLALVHSVWVANPDLRLGQLLMNAAGRTPFYTEDDLLAERLAAWATTGTPPTVDPSEPGFRRRDPLDPRGRIGKSRTLPDRPLVADGLGCSCPGHYSPGVHHMVPCCDKSHVDS